MDDDDVNLEGGDLGESGDVNTGGGSLGDESDLETVNLEGGDLGQTEAQAQEDFYKSIGIDPATMKDAPPETLAKINSIIAGDAYKASPDLIKTLMGAFSKTVNGKQVTDWDKVGLVGGLLTKATGLSKPETPGYKGTVKSYTAVNAPIQYNDPNRRPGSGGRQYFTPTSYVVGDPAAAKAAATQQAAGIAAAYPTATAPVDKWGIGATTPALAMPWAKKAAATADENTTGGVAAIANRIMTPEEKLASLQQPAVQQPVTDDPNYSLYGEGAQTVQAAQGGIMAARGRYLRGNTDGMADKINTSIDDRQPAKLSHGEFVVPADVVSHLGNGNSDAGAKKLYQMMDKIRIARTGTKKQGRQINPDKYMPGGSVGYSSGGITDGVQRFTTGGPASGTSTAGNLADWAGEAITTNIGQGIAAANQPYQGYTGPLTAGPSDLQNQYFAGVSNVASTGYDPTKFTTGTFDTTQANKYMNPYLQAALDPQLAEMRRQSQINLQPSMAKLTQAGGFGGGRQAIMESEAARNLLAEQNKTVGQGYANAYDKAMQQFNTEQGRQMEADKASEASRQYGSDFGLKSLNELQEAGKAQRDIEAEGIAADKAQFEEARDWDKKMAQYKQGLFSGLPVSTQVNTTNTNPITDWLQSGSTLSKLLESFNKP
jgi:hypothetical protein